jgi:chlorophyllide a reductase subunit Y
VMGAGSLAQVVNAALASRDRFLAMDDFFAGTGTGETSGIWEDTPKLQPKFRERYAKRMEALAKQRKSEEMI